MALFMRYCVSSMRTLVAPKRATTRSSSVVPRPAAAACGLVMTGGSCRWSPARTHLRVAVSTAHSDVGKAHAESMGKDMVWHTIHRATRVARKGG